MKHAFSTIAFITAVLFCCVWAANAQITIKLPKIKLIKPEVRTDIDRTAQDSNTRNDPKTNSIAETAPASNGGNSTNWWVDYQIGEISKYKQELDRWEPASQIFPKPSSSDDYISLAFSKKERASWLQDKKVAPDAKLDTALDELKTSLIKRLPEYTINSRSFTNRNAAEEKLLLGALSDVPGVKVFKIGFNQATWLIDKNEWGIPKARYKHGLVFGRNPASEDPFCRVWYLNVVQEYSGAGTYGPTSARYIEKEFIACPAG